MGPTPHRFHDAAVFQTPEIGRAAFHPRVCTPGMTTIAGPRFRTPSVRTVERSLAALFVALLATYVLGTLVAGSAPLLRDTGVVAVHLAIPVAGLLGVALLAHTVLGAVSDERTVPRAIEVAVLAMVVASLSLTTVAPTRSVSDLLFWTAVGASLVLVGLVLGDR